MIKAKIVSYPLGPNPRKLRHKRRNPFEIIVSWLMSSHVCQICRRKEIWSVSGWHQIDDPVHKDKNGCSVICFECCERNPELFSKKKLKYY